MIMIMQSDTLFCFFTTPPGGNLNPHTSLKQNKLHGRTKTSVTFYILNSSNVSERMCYDEK